MNILAKMKKYGAIVLLAFLILACTDASHRESEAIIMIDTVWTKGVFPHPALESFVKYNMWDPSYLQLQINPSLETTVLIRGRIKYLSGHSLWTFAVDSFNNASLHQVIIQPDSNGIYKDTIDFKFDAPGSSYAPIIIETDTGSTFLKYAVLPVERDSALIIPTPDEEQNLSQLSITDLDGRVLSGDEWNGQITVINWWATWCKPCVAEMPGLNALVPKYSQQGVKFIAINAEPQEKVARFLNTHEFIYTHYFADSTNSILLGNSFPRNLIINRDGIIVFDQVGGSETTADEVEKKLKQILADRPGT